MNARDKELWSTVCQSEMPELDETCMTLQRQTKFAELIRADERERIKVAKSPKLFFALTNLTKGIGKGELYCFGAGINAGKEKNT